MAATVADMSHLRRELPYSLVIGVCLLGGLWLSRSGSPNLGLTIMAVGVIVAVVRAVVSTRNGLRAAREQRGGHGV